MLTCHFRGLLVVMILMRPRGCSNQSSVMVLTDVNSCCRSLQSAPTLATSSPADACTQLDSWMHAAQEANNRCLLSCPRLPRLLKATMRLACQSCHPGRLTVAHRHSPSAPHACLADDADNITGALAAVCLCSPATPDEGAATGRCGSLSVCLPPPASPQSCLQLACILHH